MTNAPETESTLESWENEGGASDSGTFATAELEGALATDYERRLGGLALSLVIPQVAAGFDWTKVLSNDALHIARVLVKLEGNAVLDVVLASSDLPRARSVVALLELKKHHMLGLRVLFEEEAPPDSGAT